MAKIIPGILTASEKDYHKRLLTAEQVADLVQIDVVDGKFANNVTIGIDVIKKYLTSANLEIQLMVVNPNDYIDDLGHLDYVSRIIFPFEIEGNINENIYRIRKLSKQVGLSINPETPVNAAMHFIDDIDLLSIYAAKPGFSGQKLQEATYCRIKEAKKNAAELPVEVDIGVNPQTIPKLVKAGADFLVVTSYLNKAEDFYLAYEKLAKLAANPL